MQLKKLQDRYWYKDSGENLWYSLPNDRSVKVIHLVDTILLAPRRKLTGVNPYFERDHLKEKRKEQEIVHVNAKYRPVWERQQGKCFYCGRPLLIDQEKVLISIDHTRSQSMANCAYVHTDCTIHEYQFLKTMEDVELMTEYDVMEALKRVRGEDGTVMPKGVPDTWRYLPLFDYFGNCEKTKITLSFTEIEEILGFPLSPSQKSGKWAWYRRSGMLSMADAWCYQGYKMKHLDFMEQKVSFETVAEDLEKVVFPPELVDKKIPKKAKYEIEHYLQGIIKKYGLTTEEFQPKTRSVSSQ